MQVSHGRSSGSQPDLSAGGRPQGGSPPEPEAAAAGDRHERECPLSTCSLRSQLHPSLWCTLYPKLPSLQLPLLAVLCKRTCCCRFWCRYAGGSIQCHVKPAMVPSHVHWHPLLHV